MYFLGYFRSKTNLADFFQTNKQIHPHLWAEAFLSVYPGLDSRISIVTFPCVKCKRCKYTNLKVMKVNSGPPIQIFLPFNWSPNSAQYNGAHRPLDAIFLSWHGLKEQRRCSRACKKCKRCRRDSGECIQENACKKCKRCRRKRKERDKKERDKKERDKRERDKKERKKEERKKPTIARISRSASVYARKKGPIIAKRSLFGPRPQRRPETHKEGGDAALIVWTKISFLSQNQKSL